MTMPLSTDFLTTLKYVLPVLARCSITFSHLWFRDFCTETKLHRSVVNRPSQRFPMLSLSRVASKIHQQRRHGRIVAFVALVALVVALICTCQACARAISNANLCSGSFCRIFH